MVGYRERSLHSQHGKGFSACLGNLPPDMPRRLETIGLCYAIQCLNTVAFSTAPLSYSQIVPKVPMVEGKYPTTNISDCTDAGAASAPHWGTGHLHQIIARHVEAVASLT